MNFELEFCFLEAYLVFPYRYIAVQNRIEYQNSQCKFETAQLRTSKSSTQGNLYKK